MNRHLLISCIGIELQKALKDYTHDDLSRQVADSAAIDVLSALRDGLRVSTVQQLDALPVGALIRSAAGVNYGKLHGINMPWYQPGSSSPFPHHLRSTLLDAHLLFHPAWITKGMR